MRPSAGIRALTIYARYTCHGDATLSYIEDALCSSDTFRDVFLLSQAGKQAKANANALRPELVKKRKVDKEINGETCTLSSMWQKINSSWDCVSHEIDN
jgi:hypothetical protein